jgi:nitrite reductase/ring-hydroxylating ferredoxin subunit
MAEDERLICASGDLIDGGRGVRFEVEYLGQAAPAFVVRYCGEVRGFLNRCAHVPTELDWKPGEFFDMTGLYLICATHGALYSPATGACLGGRCDGRGLRPLRVCERGGNVFLMQEGD